MPPLSADDIRRQSQELRQAKRKIEELEEYIEGEKQLEEMKKRIAVLETEIPRQPVTVINLYTPQRRAGTHEDHSDIDLTRQERSASPGMRSLRGYSDVRSDLATGLESTSETAAQEDASSMSQITLSDQTNSGVNTSPIIFFKQIDGQDFVPMNEVTSDMHEAVKILQADFEKLARGRQKRKVGAHVEWHELTKGTSGCVRHYLQQYTFVWSTEGRGVTCRRCFNNQRPCVRYDSNTKKYFIVPLPSAVREASPAVGIGCYVYPQHSAQVKLEEDLGVKVWDTYEPKQAKRHPSRVATPDLSESGIQCIQEGGEKATQWRW